VVLDLIIEPSEEQIGEGMTAHISRRHDLPPEVVHFLPLIKQWHALVVWSEDRA
jgi:hypothetical protein